ncbi:hypothetical protein ACFVY1_25920 [Streptomyces sp. NPDC058293]
MPTEAPVFLDLLHSLFDQVARSVPAGGAPTMLSGLARVLSAVAGLV